MAAPATWAPAAHLSAQEPGAGHDSEDDRAVGCRSVLNQSAPEQELWLLPPPIFVVTHPSQLPSGFLHPDPDHPISIGFDCEGVDLCRHGRLCVMQLAFEDAVYLVDAVEGGDSLMQSCKLGLESPHVTKVVHDCKRDSEALYFQYGIRLNNVFDTQIAYTLIEELNGKKWVPDDFISFVGLLADERYCGVKYCEKEEVRSLLKKVRNDHRLGIVWTWLAHNQSGLFRSRDPLFWTHRPWTEMMKRVASDDVRFLPQIQQRMEEKLKTSSSMWQLYIRGALYCRCFCVSENGLMGWPSLPTYPSEGLENGNPEEEVLGVVDIPPGKMGRIIGKKGASILSIKECCRADIFIGGAKGPPNKIFVIGVTKEVRKAEAIIRGKIL